MVELKLLVLLRQRNSLLMSNGCRRHLHYLELISLMVLYENPLKKLIAYYIIECLILFRIRNTIILAKVKAHGLS